VHRVKRAVKITTISRRLSLASANSGKSTVDVKDFFSIARPNPTNKPNS